MRSNSKFSPLVKILKMDNRHFGYDAASGLLCEIEDDRISCRESNQYVCKS